MIKVIFSLYQVYHVYPLSSCFLAMKVEMLHTVKSVEYLEDYKILLVFNDGKVKIIDFTERLKRAKNMFLPLLDVTYFKKVKADGTTIVWPNGLDLCPDGLYDHGIEVEHQI